MIKGYEKGANISLLNVIYHKPKKNEETGKWSTGSLDIVFKDMDTMEKHVQHIKDPAYIYYMTKEEFRPKEGEHDYNKLYIERDKVDPIVCKYRELQKDIAKRTGWLEWYIENLKDRNFKENDKLFEIPIIFNADMHIEDFYRHQFDRLYKNEPFTPDKLFFDIEVDGINLAGDFPQPGECPVNAITLVHDGTKTVYTLLLDQPENPLIEEFKKEENIIEQLKEFVTNAVGGWKQSVRYGLDGYNYKIAFFKEEIALIHSAFNIINTLKPDFALAWNIAFDLPYLIERIKVLGYSPEEIICHKDFEEKEAWYFVDKRAAVFEERGDYAQISSYTVYIDQLITFASRRKGQRALSGFKLDYIGEKIAKVRKLDYSHITTNLAKLPYLDYKTFVFYNIMDTIVQKCIEVKVGDIDFVYNKCMMNNTRYSKCHRQTVYLINRFVKEFWEKGLILGNNANKRNVKEGFPGAFVADPSKISDKPKIKINGQSVNLCDNLDDFDYKALYPSTIDENNMAPNTQEGKVIIEEQLDPNENRFNNEYFDRTVYMIEDLVSGNRLDFGKRYLNLGSYEEVHDDIIEYFSTIVNPIRGLKIMNVISGNRYMGTKIDNSQKRVMAYKVNNSQHRIMVRHQERMVRFNESNNM